MTPKERDALSGQAQFYKALKRYICAARLLELADAQVEKYGPLMTTADRKKLDIAARTAKQW